MHIAADLKHTDDLVWNGTRDDLPEPLLKQGHPLVFTSMFLLLFFVNLTTPNSAGWHLKEWHILHTDFIDYLIYTTNTFLLYIQVQYITNVNV